MPTLYPTDDQHVADNRAAAGSVGGYCGGMSLYLTDEVFLYRVIGFVQRGQDEIVEVEDCYGLDVVTVSRRDLRARWLRVVTPARGDD